jgi:predicted nucleotide-binding protein
VRWKKKISEFLKQSFGPDVASLFEKLEGPDEFDELALKVGHLQGLLAKDESQATRDETGAPEQVAKNEALTSSGTLKVFVVHGHDGEAKESVARFLEKLGLDAVILHEQPNQGRTIIEKFEMSSSDVAFAVVLLTPDDFGSSAAKPSELRPRARQNVILELGYFLGRLGRRRVCAIYRGGVELPSDYQGVLYIEFDHAGAWRTKLAQEFVEAKMSINLQALIQL